MKEDVLRFRAITDVFVKKLGKTVKDVEKESGISYPTVVKILNTPIEEIHVRASILGKIQDWCKKRKDVLDYSELPDKEDEPEKPKKTEEAKVLMSSGDELFLEFLNNNASIIATGDKKYYFLPFWFEKKGGSKSLIMHRLDHLPRELKEALGNLRL